ncbi:MAG: hypothetical protein ACRDKT_13360 [Actinomycetota bacterium]
MHDDIARHLKDSIHPTNDAIDLAWVVSRGRSLRLRRRLAFATAAVVLVSVLGVGSAAILPLERDGSIDVAPPPRPGPDPQPRRAIVESIDDETQAEIFAFRALAETGVMQPYGEHTYTFTYRDDAIHEDGVWRVGFAAADCAPRGSSQTCRGLSGDDPRGNPGTDVYAVVAREDKTWTVVGLEGNVLPEHRDAVVGYSLRQHREASHWEFPAVGIAPGLDGTHVAMWALWVGPFPTEAPGSACELRTYDSDGSLVEKRRLIYQEPPNRAFEVGAWVSGTDAGDVDAVSGNVTCKQYVGSGWRVISEPELVIESDGRVVGATAELRWGGPTGFTTAAVCRAEFVDADGDVVYEGRGRIEPLWRPGDLRNHPYVETVFITTRGRRINAERVERLRCVSR